MTEITIVSIIAAIVLGVLLWDRHMEKRRLAEEMKGLKEANLELLKRLPVTSGGGTNEDPLTVEKIADAARIEGFFPETDGNLVMFKVQGKTYYVDGDRLPLLFVVKPFEIDPRELEMDLLRDAAHKMSDQLVMVKATFADDEKHMRFFVAARDRNFESFRNNLTAYMGILNDGQRLMGELYDKMVDEKREAALKANPVIPSVQHENKVLS